jgi:hypothetical protein
MTASEDDLCRLAAIVTAEREDLAAHGPPPSLLSYLMGQIRRRLPRPAGVGPICAVDPAATYYGIERWSPGRP